MLLRAIQSAPRLELATRINLWRTQPVPELTVRKVRLASCVAVGLAAGFGAWWVYAGPMTEPWDAGMGPYLAFLAGGGFLSVLLYPRSFLAGPLSTWAGQMAYSWTVYAPAAPEHDPSILLPSIATAIWGLPPAYIGAAVPMGAHKRIETMWAKVSPGQTFSSDDPTASEP